MVGRTAVLPVVLMVADQMGADAGLFQQLGHGVVKGFQRTPAPVQKVGAAGVQLPASRHTGHTADIGILELGRLPRQPEKIGRAGSNRSRNSATGGG